MAFLSSSPIQSILLDLFVQIERRNFSLRDQLKAQFKATQKAQINERKASDSKRRLTSYIFHEVRVPLNTACGSALDSLQNSINIIMHSTSSTEYGGNRRF